MQNHIHTAWCTVHTMAAQSECEKSGQDQELMGPESAEYRKSSKKGLECPGLL